MLFAEKWYRDGSQNHAFRGIERVEILNSTLSIPVRIFLKNPPPPGLVASTTQGILKQLNFSFYKTVVPPCKKMEKMLFQATERVKNCLIVFLSAHTAKMWKTPYT